MKTSIITQSFMTKQALVKSFENNFPNIELRIETDISNMSTMIDDSIVILDCNEENVDDVKKLTHLRSNNVKIVVLDNQKNEILCKKVIGIGVDGYITEFSSEEEFVYIINKMLSGRKIFDSQMVQQILNNKLEIQSKHLTNRENQVMNLVSKGLSNREISQSLKLSECTVKKHVSNILEKLNLKSRKDIIVYAKGN